jgi:hypothetical protein
MSIRSTAGMWAIVIGAVGLAGLARADITVEQQINVDGFGPSKFGAMEGKTITSISGDRARTEHQSQFKSKLLRALAKGSSTNTVHIIRLDVERIDDIDTPDKQYSETTFQEMRDATAKALQNAQNAQNSKPAAQQQAPSGAPVDDSQCEWSPARAELRQTGEHASFAGADASRATITVTQTCTDKTKGTSCDFVFLLDQWMAADIPGTAETREFWRNYARKMNLSGEMAENMQVNSQQVFERYKKGWGEALKQAGSLKGYPVKSVFAMQFGGPQCKDDSSSSGNGGGENSGSGSSGSSSSVPTSPSAAVGSVAMSLFNKMHKKDDAPPPADTAPAAPGMVQLFQMSTETVALRTDAIPGAAFEVPAGYKRVDKPVMGQ